MARRDSRQQPLFPVSAFVPQPYEPFSIYDMVARFGPAILRREDFPIAEDSRGGESGWCPVQLSALVLLQRHHGWRDRETVRRASVDLQVKACLGLGVEQRGPSQPTLCRHRQLMQTLGVDGVYERRLRDILEALELVGDDEPVLIDSVPVTGAGQQLDTYNLLAAAVRQGVLALARARGRKPEDVAAEMDLEHYLGRTIKGRFEVDWTSEPSRVAFLAQLVEDALRVRQALTLESSDDEGSDDDDDALDVRHEVVEAIDDIIEHDVERDDDGSVSGIVQRAADDRRISITDGDMRHGRKSASQLIAGFKAQIVASLLYGFIVIARVFKANEHDGAMLPELVKELAEQGTTPAWWGGDHAYGTLANHRFFASGEHGELIARMARPSNGGRFTKDEFAYDFEHHRLRCPNGHEATFTWHKRHQKKGRLFSFAAAQCSGCPMRDKCVSPKAAADNGRTVFIVEDEEHLIRQHLEQRQHPDFLDKLAQRPTVERVIAGFAQCGGKQAHRFGRENVQFDTNLSALGYNLRRLGNILRSNAALADRAARLLPKAFGLFLRLLERLTNRLLRVSSRLEQRPASIAA